MICRILIFVWLVMSPFVGLSQLYELKTGNISFSSEARQELIKASSDGLKGVLNIAKKTFVMKVGIASFKGFNSPLQREHFNENYMETGKYPFAYFSGKIIEDINLAKDGECLVRTKGKLTVHGVEQERIIYSKLTVKDNMITIYSDFVVSLADHNIKIPRVVSEKLATNIKVTVKAALIKK